MINRKDSELPLGLRYEDLPPWMRKTRREADWAFLVVAVLCLIIIWPLIVRPGLPYNPGMQAEVGRSVEMAESIQVGVLYPRWASDFNYGYGSPLWNYLAPLPHYLTGLHHVLAQTHPDTSVKMVMALSLGLCGLGMFSFVRRRWGTYAGLLAAAVFLYSPQLALVKSYLASDLGSLLAMGMFLMTLWAFDRLSSSGRGSDMGIAACMLAGLWLSQTPLNLVLTGVLVGWLVWRWKFRIPEKIYHARVWVSVGGGIGISAFYWLPAWIERTEVRWLATGSYPLDAWRLISPKESLAPPTLLDLSAVNPAPALSIGVAVWGLACAAIAAILVWAWRRTPPDTRPVTRGEALQRRIVTLVRTFPAQPREALYFLIVGLLVFGLITPFARSFWDTLPDWPVLYPRDLLLLIAACGAIMTGQIGYLLERSRRFWRAAAGMCMGLSVVLVCALPTLALPSWPDTRMTPDVTTALRNEMRGYAVASQLTGWLLPRTVEEPPQPASALIASYESGVVDKVARNALPAAVQVDTVRHNPQMERLVVKTANPVEMTLLAFYFPGWKVKIDGSPAAIRPQPQTGLISLEIPAGQHEVVIWFGSTPVRNIAWIISGTSLLIILGLSLRSEARQGHDSGAPPSGQVPGEHVYPFVLLFVVLLFGIGGAVPRLAVELFTVKSAPGVVESAQYSLPLALQGGVDLLAYDIEPGVQVAPGDYLTVTLYWRAVRPDLPDYQANLVVAGIDTPNRVVGVAQHRHPGMIPSSQWPTWPLLDHYVQDTFYIQVNQNAPFGEYNIIVQVGRCSQPTPLPCEAIEPLFVRDGRGSRLGQNIVLPTILEVTP